LLQVYGLPALILFKNGVAVAKREGAISKKMILDWLKEHGVALAA
jgi:thioredoxin-like negative regulator of GroEL